MPCSCGDSRMDSISTAANDSVEFALKDLDFSVQSKQYYKQEVCDLLEKTFQVIF